MAGLHRRLVDRQRRLNENAATLHEVHEPWGLTPFEIQSALLGIPDQARTPVRLAAPELITAGRRGDRAAAAGQLPRGSRIVLLYAAAAQTLTTLDAGVYRAGPERLALACGDGAGLKFRERHALRKQARALWRPAAAPAAEPSREEPAAALTEAGRQFARWRELSGGLPALPSSWPGAAWVASSPPHGGKARHRPVA